MENMAFELNVVEIDRWLKKNGKNSREKLAVQMGCSGTLIDRIRKRRTLPMGETLVRLSVALALPVEKLVVRVDP